MNEADSEFLPPALERKPENRYQWDFPTAWLLGTRFLASLSDIAISMVFDVDPRDWMTAGDPIDLQRGHTGDEFWIDFVADSGDSPRLVYQLAYLLQQEQLEVTGTDRTLPQGNVLLFGGDTAYPVASRRQLLERVRAPFIWARRDLRAIGKLSPRTDIPLLGIPGNHDYYNALAGFERLFHVRPFDPDAKPDQRVELPGFVPQQRASYFAAILPFGWQLWGLDMETHDIDQLQKDYFAAATGHAQFGHKRIVATSRPTFVNHGYSEKIQEISARFAKVGLEPAFKNRGKLDHEVARLDLSGDTHLYERYWGTDLQAPPPAVHASTKNGPSQRLDNVLRCLRIRRRRTDIPVRPMPLPDHVPSSTADAQPTPQRASYASVVSGLGGAFHHPSQVRARGGAELPERTPRVAWPGRGASERAVGEQLLRPRKLFQAGAVGVVGMAIAAITYPTQTNTVLDVPFDERSASLAHFLGIASIAITLVVLAALTTAFVLWGKRLHQQLRDLVDPTGWWGRVTNWISNTRFIFGLSRWLGINRRNVWGVAITSPAWGLTILAWSAGFFAMWKCHHLHVATDGSLRTYITLILLVLFMAGLALAKIRSRHGLAAGILIGIPFGALTGALLVWTPYAWTRLLASHSWCLLLLAAQNLTRRVLVATDIFQRTTSLRRGVCALAYLAILAIYVGVPIACTGAPSPSDHPSWGIVACAALGAYLSCVWIGWYFCLCLQWNVHGNEAGVAARIVQFAEFLRIRVTQECAEVWVVGVQDAAGDGVTPTARLIDHFSVGVEKTGEPCRSNLVRNAS